ncbi:hypothetical protein TNCV_3303071 [Trichonephila clavipes]|nr:hypothetical protein TNCV_3303071 [Trichonephila clavipes]
MHVKSVEAQSSRCGRKRRSSADDGVMDDCMAAMVLMSLSCSPKSPCLPITGESAPGEIRAYVHRCTQGAGKKAAPLENDRRGRSPLLLILSGSSTRERERDRLLGDQSTPRVFDRSWCLGYRLHGEIYMGTIGDRLLSFESRAIIEYDTYGGTTFSQTPHHANLNLDKFNLHNPPYEAGFNSCPGPGTRTRQK